MHLHIKGVFWRGLQSTNRMLRHSISPPFAHVEGFTIPWINEAVDIILEFFRYFEWKAYSIWHGSLCQDD